MLGIRAPQRGQRLTGALPALSLVLLVGTAAWFWLSYVPRQRAEAIDSWCRDLALRADLRKEALERLVTGKLADAATVASYPTVLLTVAGKAAGAALGPAPGEGEHAYLQQLLDDFARLQKVVGVALWDGEAMLVAKSRDFVVEEACTGAAREVLSTGRPLAGFHPYFGADAVLGFGAPVKSQDGLTHGAVVIAVDPHQWVYPFLARPFGARTGEAVLVARERDDIVYLSPLHHRPDAPLTFRRPIKGSGFAARKALTGSEFAGEYLDYRGVRVLGAGRRVPQTPWAVVVSVEEEEALASFRERVRRAAFEAATVSLALLGVVWGFWFRRERRQRAALAEKEATLRSILDGMLEGYAHCRMLFENDQPRDFVYLDVNPAFDRLTGLTDVAGKRVTEVIPGIRESNPEAFDVFGRVASTGKPEVFETYVPALKSWFSFSVFSPRNGEFVGVFDNITERKRAEEKLRESEERFRSIFAVVAEGITMQDRRGHIVACNASAERILGFTAEQILGKTSGDPTWSAVHEDGSPWPGETRPIVETLRTGRSHHDVVIGLHRADGELQWIKVNTEPIPGPDGTTPLGAVASFTDITVRKRDEEALREAERKYRSIFENALEGIFQTTPEGRFIALNPAFARMLGYESPEEVLSAIQDVGSQLWVHPERRLEYRRLLEAQGMVRGFETELRRKDGTTLRVSGSSRAVRGPKGAIERYEGTLEDITERKHVEEAILKQKTILETVMGNMAQAMLIVDKDLRVVAFNGRFEPLFGFAPGEMRTGDSLETFIRIWAERTNAGPAHLEKVLGALRRKEPFVSDYRQRVGDGPVTWIQLFHNPLPKGGFVRTYTDITGRKRAEEALRLEKLFSDTATASLPGVFYVFGLNGRMVRWNENLERVSEFSGEEIGRMTALDFFPDAEKSLAANAIKEVFGRGEAAVELSLVTKSGRSIRFLFTGRRMQSGEEMFLVGMGVDIAALRTLEQRYRSLMENVADAIFIARPDGTILEANRAAERLHGRTRQELISLRLMDLFSTEERSDAQQHFQRMLAAGDAHDPHRYVLRADGVKVPIDVSTTPIEIGEEKMVIAIVRDVSERSRLEGELRQAQKMEAVGRLAGGVAHDFNNLLTVIQGYGEMLAASFEKDPARIEQVTEIVRAAERAASLTRQLLAFSRRQALETRLFDLGAAVGETEKMLRRLIGEDIEVNVVKPREPATVKADPGQIEQVLMNLAVNARDAMPEGGRLSVEVSEIRLGKELQATPEPVPAGSYVVLMVSDTGSGMDAETLSHLFEPFFTTKEKGKGTGLGLATVYGIVKQSGGYVTVESEPGRGAMFRVFLPRAEGEPVAGPQARAEGAGGTETILLVEDETPVRELTRRFLEGRGYRVLAAGSGAEALELVDRHGGPIHLLLTDLVMPGMSGRKLAENLALRRPETKVLFISGYSSGVFSRTSPSEGGAHFLQKPFTEAALARSVREALDGPASGPTTPKTAV